jgi:SAM-dependent methyltransferase
MSITPRRRLDRLRPLVQRKLGRGTSFMPVSRSFGFDRGLPIDRHYIEDFLGRHGGWPGYAGGDITGRVMEVGADTYTRRFGGDRVERSDVLHVSADNDAATIVGDLATGAGVPHDRFDCVICTQTLNVVFDVRAAVKTLHGCLAPGGVLLLTVAGICQAARPDRDLWGDYWRFTPTSVRRLLEERFAAADVRVEAYGNLATAVAFLQGRASEELGRDELGVRDPDYDILIAARARRQA